MAQIKFILFIAIATWLSACSKGAKTERGFSLPSGDVENGSVVFDDLQCAACHTIYRRNNAVLQRAVNVRLGGPDKTYTYEFLLTSVINPSHKLAAGYEPNRVSIKGESKMRRYNDFLTVTELVDLVEYLKSALSVSGSPVTRYRDLTVPTMKSPDGQENY